VCSSSEVYGQVLENEIPITENQPFRPANPYGVSKCCADLYAKLYYDNYKMPIIRTRMFTHTGYGRTMESAEVSFARQIALIEKGLQPPVIKVGNLDSIRTIADVRDAVRAYYLLVRKCKYGEVYNIGGDKVMSIRELLNYLISLSPYKEFIKVEVDPKKLRPSDVTLQIPDSSKFKNETNWKPEFTFEDTMKSLLDFWRTRV
jgi:GDPmannose 4,6-dehydratase